MFKFTDLIDVMFNDYKKITRELTYVLPLHISPIFTHGIVFLGRHTKYVLFILLY